MKKNDKWYKTIKYFLAPLMVFLTIYFFISVLLESFGINNALLLHILKNHLHINDVFRLGKMFWTVSLKLVFLLLMVVLSIVIIIGFYKKEAYGRTTLSWFLILSFISFLFDYLYYMFPNRIFAIFSNINLKSCETFLVETFKLNIFIASLIVFVVWAILLALFFFGMYDTMQYLFNRKHLFGEKSEKEDNNKWQCLDCGTINKGEFCVHCGISKEYMERKYDMEKTIELVLPEEKKGKSTNDVSLSWESSTNKEKEDISLALNTNEKVAQKDIEMQVDTNPFAVKVDKNISLEINEETKVNTHEYCPKCGTKCDGLTYCLNCGKKLR